MEILIGLVTGLVFFLCLVLAFWLGTKVNKATIPTKSVEETEDVKKQDELKKREEGFKNIMNYDYEQALKRKYE